MDSQRTLMGAQKFTENPIGFLYDPVGFVENIGHVMKKYVKNFRAQRL